MADQHLQCDERFYARLRQRAAIGGAVIFLGRLQLLVVYQVLTG